MADYWPTHYTVQETAKFLQDELPRLRNEIQMLKERIAYLETNKADRRGRKPNAGVQTAGEELKS